MGNNEAYLKLFLVNDIRAREIENNNTAIMPINDKKKARLEDTTGENRKNKVTKVAIVFFSEIFVNDK